MLSEELKDGSCAPVPAVGWAAGVDRLVILRQELGLGLPPPTPGVHVIAARTAGMEEATRRALDGFAMHVAAALRQSPWGTPVSVSVDWHASLKVQIKSAAKAEGAKVAVFLGEEEMGQGTAMVKDLAAGTQVAVPLEALAEHVAGVLGTSLCQQLSNHGS